MVEPIAVHRTGTYIPKWGNAEREEEDKIRVCYRFLSLSEEQRIVAETNRGLDKSLSEDERLAEVIGRQWIARVQAMIQSIENLSIVTEQGEVTQIADGATLFGEPGLVELGYEIIQELRDKTAVDKKKLPLVSDSGGKDKAAKT